MNLNPVLVWISQKADPHIRMWAQGGDTGFLPWEGVRQVKEWGKGNTRGILKQNTAVGSWGQPWISGRLCGTCLRGRKLGIYPPFPLYWWRDVCEQPEINLLHFSAASVPISLPLVPGKTLRRTLEGTVLHWGTCERTLHQGSSHGNLGGLERGLSSACSS